MGVPDSSAPGPEAIQAPSADSPVAPGEAPQPEELLSPGLTPESADATPPDAEVGVPDSSAPGPEAIQASSADSPVAPGEAPQPEEVLSIGPAPDSATSTPPDAKVGVPDSSAPGPEAIQAPPADSPVAPGEAPQPEELLSPGLTAREKLMSTPPDAEVGVSDSSAPGPEAIQASSADSPVAPGEAPQPEKLLSPVLAPESADATPPDAEVGVPDSSAPGPEALQAPSADSPVAPGEAPQAEKVISPGPAPDDADATPPDAEVGVPDSSAPGPEAIQAPSADSSVAPGREAIQAPSAGSLLAPGEAPQPEELLSPGQFSSGLASPGSDPFVEASRVSFSAPTADSFQIASSHIGAQSPLGTALASAFQELSMPGPATMAPSRSPYTDNAESNSGTAHEIPFMSGPLAATAPASYTPNATMQPVTAPAELEGAVQASLSFEPSTGSTGEFAGRPLAPSSATLTGFAAPGGSLPLPDPAPAGAHSYGSVQGDTVCCSNSCYFATCW